ncbi:MAG: DUF1801 domain-containing protein [Candidatus Doudnabacteria bacterium]|nr:DUF1801 domain-containing protein [Candidatus Doudnabacteria bacterium]
MKPAAELIDNRIAETGGWRGEVYAKLRKIVNEADPELSEEWKWDTAVWLRDGLVCAVSAFREAVKINFFKGALLSDPHKMINNGFTSKQHRSIDFHEGDEINEAALKEMIREAVGLNLK